MGIKSPTLINLTNPNYTISTPFRVSYCTLEIPFPSLSSPLLPALYLYTLHFITHPLRPYILRLPLSFWYLFFVTQKTCVVGSSDLWILASRALEADEFGCSNGDEPHQQTARKFETWQKPAALGSEFIAYASRHHHHSLLLGIVS